MLEIWQYEVKGERKHFLNKAKHSFLVTKTQCVQFSTMISYSYIFTQFLFTFHANSLFNLQQKLKPIRAPEAEQLEVKGTVSNLNKSRPASFHVLGILIIHYVGIGLHEFSPILT